MKKLQVIKVKLQSWNKEGFSIIEESKAKISLDLEILDLIKESRNLNANEWEERLKLKNKSEFIIKNEESHWRKKSRLKSFKETNSNTKFFHKMVYSRTCKNHISRIQIDGSQEINNLSLNISSFCVPLLLTFVSWWTAWSGDPFLVKRRFGWKDNLRRAKSIALSWKWMAKNPQGRMVSQIIVAFFKKMLGDCRAKSYSCLCLREEEFINHLFIHCDMAHTI